MTPTPLVRRCGLALLALLLWVVPLELASRLWIRARGDALSRAMLVLQLDPAVGWRQRPGFRGRFLDKPLRTDAQGFRVPDSGPRGAPVPPSVLVLGPSSSFGWGVADEDAYPRRLERLLRASRDGGGGVLNAGQIGYSSWQGLELYRRELRGLRPEWVVIAYGANDVDRYRFFFSDPRPDGRALACLPRPWSIPLQNLLRRLALLQLSQRQAQRWAEELSCLLRRGGPPEGSAPPSRRVPLEDYVANLDELLALARSDGAKVVLMTTPLRLRPDAPLDADLSEARFRLSQGHREQGRCAEARRELEEARRSDVARLRRDLLAYNRAVRDLARRRHAGLLDAERLAAGPDAGRLFLDAVHFTPEGHERVARGLLRLILPGRATPEGPPHAG